MARRRPFNSHPFQYHAEIELEVSTLTNLGVGLGRVALEPGQPPGWVVMVPAALPGELVRVRVFRNHKNYSEADIVAVLRPSPHRIAPRCPLFGSCGGCQYQNLAYSEQLRWKRQHVAELLKFMAKLEFPVNPVISSPQEFGYRSKITPHFDGAVRDAAGVADTEADSTDRSDPNDRTALPVHSAGAAAFPIGFLKQGTRFTLLDVPRCAIATDAINEKLTAVRAEVRAKAAAGGYERGATVLLRHSLEGVTTDYEATITEEVEGVRLRFLARDFFQNNPFILPAFTGYVREQAAASGARFLVDAYCGSGLFGLTAARKFERVTGIEISESSVRWARENAAANAIANATFQVGDAAAIFAGLDFPAAETAVVIDPPRRGCDEPFLQQLLAFGPRTVVYVSCDPATQMRDLATLLPGGYELAAVQPFDLFPQTRHLECVITLRRKPV